MIAERRYQRVKGKGVEWAVWMGIADHPLTTRSDILAFLPSRARGPRPWRGENSVLFETLKSRCPEAWDAYIRHAFVRRLAAGSLPLACFRHYLKQDYLFLVQFCRAYGLAVFKSRDLDEIRAGFEGLKAMA